MSLFTAVGKALTFLYLPNVDARFEPREPQKSRVMASAGKPLWNTAEFKVYGFLFAIVVPWMIKTAIDVSSSSNPNYPVYEKLLSNGWIPGRKVDNSDAQYRFFRDNFLLLMLLLLAHTGIRRAVEYVTKCSRPMFDFVFGFIFIFAVHGVNSIRVIAHVMIFFTIARVLKNYNKAAVLLLWSYGIFSLFFNDKYRNYYLSYFWKPLTVFDPGFMGIVKRWDVFYNFTLLRALSFNLDYLKSHNDKKSRLSKKTDEEGSGSNPSSPKFNPAMISEERERINANLDISDYNLFNYFSYLFYAPLFIAGPILTFNDFFIQSRAPLPSINWRRTANYALIFFICVLNMELILHFIYVVAISKAKAWKGDTPFQISMIGLFNLNIIWLKLLIPWRFFRLWALVDGIDPPENMIRCMDNNYSALAFWKGWHRSYNKFVVKYIYIPLGGGSNRVLASLAVFTFVAVWHDIQLRLLLWGWCVVLFLLPELFISKYFKQFSGEWWYRHICAAGGALNIWLMMIANLYGFCLDHDGMKLLFTEMFSTFDGLVFFVLACASLFIAVQVMFEYREEEKRHGLDVKC